jgi:hypothetical protein
MDNPLGKKDSNGQIMRTGLTYEIAVQNSKKGCSKVVDDNGEPLVVYHGVRYGNPDLRFTTFKTVSDGDSYPGSYFTDNKRVAIDYANSHKLSANPNGKYKKYNKNHLYECFLNFRKSFVFEGEFNTYEILLDEISDFISRILPIEIKNKGVIIKNIIDAPHGEYYKYPHCNIYIAFNPEQIKLADGSNTTFDAHNADIRFENGGEIRKVPMDFNTEFDYTWGDKIKGTDQIIVAHSTSSNLLPYIQKNGLKIDTVPVWEDTTKGKIYFELDPTKSYLGENVYGWKAVQKFGGVNVTLFVKVRKSDLHADTDDSQLGIKYQKNQKSCHKDIPAENIIGARFLMIDVKREDFTEFAKLFDDNNSFAAGGQVKGYAGRISENLTHMGTEATEWTAVPIIGFNEIEVNGKEKKMPLFDFPKGYSKAPTLYPMNTTGDYNCELCSKSGITTVYHIQNDKKKWVLSVGSECVTHFGPGVSGKDNERAFKIQAAKLLDADLVKFQKIIFTTFSAIKDTGYGRKERYWKSFYVGGGQDTDYFKQKHDAIVQIDPILLFKDHKLSETLYWHYVYNSIPSFNFESQVSGRHITAKEDAIIETEKKLLSWYTRNEKFATAFLQQLVAVLNLYKKELPEGTDISSAYLESLNSKQNREQNFAEGGTVNDKIFTGQEVWQSAMQAGSENNEALNDLEDTIKSNSYTVKKISISQLCDNDVDLKNYINNEKPEKLKYRPIVQPVIIGNISRGGPIIKNTVIDGFHRILQAIHNGDTDIIAYVPVKKEFKNGGVIPLKLNGFQIENITIKLKEKYLA